MAQYGLTGNEKKGLDKNQSLGNLNQSIDSGVDLSRRQGAVSEKKGGKLGANTNMNSSSFLDGVNDVNATQATHNASRTIQRDTSALSFLNNDQSIFVHDESKTQISQTKRTNKSRRKSNSHLGDDLLDENERESGELTDRSTRSGKAGKSKPKFKKPYTAEDHKLKMRQRKQREHLRELELLTSDNCPKRHPFDFRPGELQEIKQLFIDIQIKGKSEQQIAKAKERIGGKMKQGLPIEDLQNHFLKLMKLDINNNEEDKQLIDMLIQKLDHLHLDKITWPEFLKFMEFEGKKREEVNDAQLYGIPVKRMKEIQRINLKETPNQIEYIDCCVYIKFGANFKFLLALFDNNAAKIFDTKDFKVKKEHELTFPSSYAQPKPKSTRPQSTRTSVQKPALSVQKTEQETSKRQDSLKTKSTKQFTMEDISSSYSTAQPKVGGLKGSISQAIKEGLNPKAKTQKPPAPGGSQRAKNQNNPYSNEAEDGFKQRKIRSQRKLSSASAKNLRGQMNGLQKSASETESIQSANTYGYKTQQSMGNFSTLEKGQRARSDFKSNLDIIHERPARPSSKQGYNTANPYQIQRQETVQEKNKRLLQEKMRLAQKYSRKLGSSKGPQVRHPVLGIDPLQDADGSSAFYASKDMEKDESGYGVRFLLPNLYSEYKSNKDEYDKEITSIEKQVHNNDNYIKKMQPVWSEKQLNKSNSQKGLGRFQKVDERKREDMKNLILGQKRVVDVKMDRLKTKQNNMAKMLEDLQETNKYFYRVTSPTPYESAQQQYLKRQLEKKGIDVTNQLEVRQHLTQMGIIVDDKMIKHITGRDIRASLNNLTQMAAGMSADNTGDSLSMEQANTLTQRKKSQKQFDTHLIHQREAIADCTPDMISKYVDGPLKQKKLKQAAAGGIKSKMADMSIGNAKKLKEMQTKSVYGVCATFNEEFALLALALIDKEIKIYRVKQNGAKISFVDHISFYAAHTVTCICIERCVSKSKPILCCGSEDGRIIIYYLDEPIIDKDTGLPNLEGIVKEKLHTKIKFFKPPKNTQLPGKEQTQIDVEQIDEKNQGGDDLDFAFKVERKKTNSKEKDKMMEMLNESSKSDDEGKSTKSSTEKKQQQKLNSDKPQTEITQIKYVRDIGLICSTFSGTVKFFDAFNFHEQWCSSNKSRKENQHTNITAFDVCSKLGLMATGGAEGKLILIDPYALGILNSVEAHPNCEILQLYIFTDQQQIITVAADRSIGLWNASRLEKIEVIKDVGEKIHCPKFTSSTFDQQNGQLFIGCQQITVWEAQIEPKVEINALQIQTLSKHILKERKMLDYQDPGYDPSVAAVGQCETKKLQDTDAKTGKVLVTSQSTLVEIVVNQSDQTNFLITIDSENLLRGWNVPQSMTTLSYRLPILGRITAAAVDNTNKFLAVGTNTGESKIINLQSGGVLYNLPHCSQEVTFLKFSDGMSEYWLFGACWGGKLMMWTQPNEDNNFTVSAKCRIGHKSDVLNLDCSSNFIVSGGVDGIVSVWNVFSGQLKYAITIPGGQEVNSPGKKKKKNDEMFDSDSGSIVDSSDEDSAGINDSNSMKRSIVGLCFHPYYQNHICIMQEGGDIHMVDGTNGVISHRNLAKAKMNSNWACDPEGMRMLIVGDLGKACLFDISMGAKDDEDGDEEPISALYGDGSKPNSVPGSGIKKKSGYNSPPKYLKVLNRPYDGEFSPIKASGESNGRVPMKWTIEKNWFQAHRINKMEPNYIVSVKFIIIAKVFATGTTTGEVKLWDNKFCDCLGVVNSPKWNPKDLLAHINPKQPVIELIQEIEPEPVQEKGKGEKGKNRPNPISVPKKQGGGLLQLQKVQQK